MFQLADGRQHVYQWDINVKLLLDESNESADEVHFSARFSRVSLSVEVVRTEDSSYVTIPNILLQKPNDIIAYSYITNADGSYTKYNTIIPVIARPKPSGYIYEETEILTWKSLDDKIDDLGESTANSVKYTEQELTDEQKSQARTNIGAVSVGEVPEQVQTDWEQKDDTAADYLKNKPFYLEKTLVVDLTKDDFVMDDEGHPFYTSSLKLDWMTSVDKVSVELNMVYNDGTSDIITEESAGIYFETIREDDGRETAYFGDDDNFTISSGPEDSFSITIWNSYERFAEIHIALYRNYVKKIPGKLVDAAIGKTAVNVFGWTYNETGDNVFVEVPAIDIPVKANQSDENSVFYDTETGHLRIPAKIMPWNGSCQIRLNYALSTDVGYTMPFSLKEGDAAWEVLPRYGDQRSEILFSFTIPGSTKILTFMVGVPHGRTVTALTPSEDGDVYLLKYTYSTDYKTIDGTIRRIL